MIPESDIRRDQANFHRRTVGGTDQPKKKFVAKGHDAQLQDAQFNNIQVQVALMNADHPIVGAVVKRDKFTITVQHILAGVRRETIIFKHAIESLTLLREVK